MLLERVDDPVDDADAEDDDLDELVDDEFD